MDIHISVQRGGAGALPGVVWASELPPNSKVVGVCAATGGLLCDCDGDGVADVIWDPG